MIPHDHPCYQFAQSLEERQDALYANRGQKPINKALNDHQKQLTTVRDNMLASPTPGRLGDIGSKPAPSSEISKTTVSRSARSAICTRCGRA